MSRRRRNQARQQPPLPTSEPPAEQPPLPGDKVCIVFNCIGSEGPGKPNVHYKLCVVDLYSDDVIGGVRDEYNDVLYTPISPTLQIDTGIAKSFVDHAFCVLNQTLYVFEGYDQLASNADDRKSIFTYDLQSLINTYDSKTKTMIYLHQRDLNLQTLSSTKTLTKVQILSTKTLTKVGDMVIEKLKPSAVPTPDGKKILLLDIQLDDMSGRMPGDVFELFDPSTLSSEPLPPIPNLPKCHSNLCVTLHGFISMFKYMVHIPDSGNFVIDLEQEERSWKCIPNHLRHGFKQNLFCIEDRFLFTPYMVLEVSDKLEDMKHLQRIPSYFVSSTVPWYDYGYPVDRVGDLTLLKDDKDKGECYFCLLHSESRWFEDKEQKVCSPYSNLNIDVCRAVYPKKGGEDEKPLEVVVECSRALKLSTEPDDYDYDITTFSPCFLFAL